MFGGNYYKLVVYAIPYTNNKYDEENKTLTIFDGIETINARDLILYKEAERVNLPNSVRKIEKRACLARSFFVLPDLAFFAVLCYNMVLWNCYAIPFLQEAFYEQDRIF